MENSITATDQGESFAPTYLTAMGHFVLEFANNYMPVVYPLLIVSMGLTYSQVGTLALVITICGALFQPLFGLLADRSDPRRVSAWSVIWVGLSMALVGYVQNYWLLAVVVGLGSLGASSFHPSGAIISAAVPENRRGAAVSVFSVAGNLGSALSPLLMGAAIATAGLRSTALLAPLGLAAGVFAALQLRNYPALSNHHNNGQTRSTTNGAARQGSMLALIMMTLYVGVRSWFQGGFVTYLPEWLHTGGQSLEAASLLLSTMMIAMSVGSFVGGPLSDRVGRMPVLLVSMGLMIPFIWLVLHLTGPAQAAAAVLLGLSSGVSFPASILMAQEAWPSGTGLASAMVMGIGWLPYGFGSLLVGWLADHSTLSSALNTLVWAPLAGLVAALIYYWDLRRRKNPLT